MPICAVLFAKILDISWWRLANNGRGGHAVNLRRKYSNFIKDLRCQCGWDECVSWVVAKAGARILIPKSQSSVPFRSEHNFTSSPSPPNSYVSFHPLRCFSPYYTASERRIPNPKLFSDSGRPGNCCLNLSITVPVHADARFSLLKLFVHFTESISTESSFNFLAFYISISPRQCCKIKLTFYGPKKIIIKYHGYGSDFIACFFFQLQIITGRLHRICARWRNRKVHVTISRWLLCTWKSRNWLQNKAGRRLLNQRKTTWRTWTCMRSSQSLIQLRWMR